MARIKNHDLTVLIDSGSTYNFISERIANWLQLPVIPTKPFNVKVENGNPLKCQGRFENIQVLLQGIPFFLTLYALPLCGLDLVLGVQWLEQLGTMAYDCKKMTMDVARQKISAAFAGDYLLFLLGSLESPPSIMVTRNLWSARV